MFPHSFEFEGVFVLFLRNFLENIGIFDAVGGGLVRMLKFPCRKRMLYLAEALILAAAIDIPVKRAISGIIIGIEIQKHPISVSWAPLQVADLSKLTQQLPLLALFHVSIIIEYGNQHHSYASGQTSPSIYRFLQLLHRYLLAWKQLDFLLHVPFFPGV